MNLIAWILFNLFFALSGVSSFAQEPAVSRDAIDQFFLQPDACLDRSLAEDVLKNLEVTPQITTASLCANNEVPNHIVRALIYLKYGTFEKGYPSGDDLFENSLGDSSRIFSYFSRFTSKIKIASPSDCQPGTVAYVSARDPNRTINICPAANVSPVYLAIMMLHEASHLAGTGHLRCENDGNLGGWACDDKIHGHGGHFYSVEYAVQIAKFGKNFSHEDRSIAKSVAISYAENAFNKKPKSRSYEVVALRSRDNKIYYLNASLVPKSSGFAVNGPIFDTGYGTIVHLNEKSDQMTSKSLYGNQQPTLEIQTNAFRDTYQKVNKSKDTLNFWADIFGNNLSTLTMYYQDLLSVRLPIQVEGSTMMSAQGCGLNVGPEGPSGVISTADGKYFSVFVVASGQSHQVRLVPIEACANQVLQLAKIGSRRLALFADGILMEKQNEQWIPVESVRNLRFNFLSRNFPVYSFLIDEKTDAIPPSSDFTK